MLKHIIVKDNILNEAQYKLLFSVEELNRAVLEQGLPFRDAYKNIATQIANETFSPNKTLAHTHEGSIGNLCTAEISAAFKNISDKIKN